MKTPDEGSHVYLVGELLQQVLASARQRLSGDETKPTPVPRIARRLRRRRRPAPPHPSPSGSAFQDPVSPGEALWEFFERIKEEVARNEEREEWIRRAMEARRMRDATDEKRAK